VAGDPPLLSDQVTPFMHLFFFRDLIPRTSPQICTIVSPPQGLFLFFSTAVFNFFSRTSAVVRLFELRSRTFRLALWRHPPFR